MDQKATLSVDQVSSILGISRNSAYQGIRDGEIPSIKIGKRILVPRAAFMRLLDPQGAEAAQG